MSEGMAEKSSEFLESGAEIYLRATDSSESHPECEVQNTAES